MICREDNKDGFRMYGKEMQRRMQEIRMSASLT